VSAHATAAGGPVAGGLPVATPAQVRRRARALARRHRGALAVAVGLHAAAALAGLAGPALLGLLVDSVRRGTSAARVDQVALAVLAALLAQVVLVRFARLASYVLGERALAELREEFLDGVLGLPLGTVEEAGTGATCSPAPPATSRTSPRWCASPRQRR
jgi:ABC-type bacteriocin/lantibiotic exporter with double-glycine peptidase domain